MILKIGLSLRPLKQKKVCMFLCLYCVCAEREMKLKKLNV